jgi:hypothetical protein
VVQARRRGFLQAWIEAGPPAKRGMQLAPPLGNRSAEVTRNVRCHRCRQSVARRRTAVAQMTLRPCGFPTQSVLGSRIFLQPKPFRETNE